MLIGVPDMVMAAPPGVSGWVPTAKWVAEAGGMVWLPMVKWFAESGVMMAVPMVSGGSVGAGPWVVGGCEFAGEAGSAGTGVSGGDGGWEFVVAAGRAFTAVPGGALEITAAASLE